jgi:hypothetical protein
VPIQLRPIKFIDGDTIKSVDLDFKSWAVGRPKKMEGRVPTGVNLKSPTVTIQAPCLKRDRGKQLRRGRILDGLGEKTSPRVAVCGKCPILSVTTVERASMVDFPRGVLDDWREKGRPGWYVSLLPVVTRASWERCLQNLPTWRESTRELRRDGAVNFLGAYLVGI